MRKNNVIRFPPRRGGKNFDEATVRFELVVENGCYKLMLYSPSAKGSESSRRFNTIARKWKDWIENKGGEAELRFCRDSSSGAEIADSLLITIR